MFNNNNHIWGLFFIVLGGIGVFFAIGDLFFRIMVCMLSLSVINYGLRLRGMPPLQFLIPLFIGRSWF